MRPIAERLSATVAQLVLRWALEQPGMTAVIAGSRNPRHAIANAASGDLRLDADTLAELDALFAS
jgi:aryl-alcohol dehydrogenase-like predicted oxidoreductase